MRHRSTSNWIRVAVQDSFGTAAPAIFVEVDPKDKDAHKKALAEAKKRSGLSRFDNWNFR